MADPAVVVERCSSTQSELVLRQAGDAFELIANGVFLMDTRDGESERELIRHAVRGLRGAHVLIAGLGLGFSAAEALARPEVRAITVVEIEPRIVHWVRTTLREVTRVDLDEPRIHVVVEDLATHLAQMERRVDAICLDIDNGPDWLVHEANARLYGPEGLALLRARLEPGGRLTVWSPSPSQPFLAHLRGCFEDVYAVTVPRSGLPPDVVYVATP